jgi:aspartyl-tRNA(Asn)/glutamyl-tRNA(Gln) amidotransferase subunit B
MRRVGITRVHMEEDAGKSLHEGFADSDRKTYVDYNRSGVPLIEIVTDPDLRCARRRGRVLHTSARPARLARRQRREHGRGKPALRCERLGPPRGATALGTKAEVKNLNSFRFLQKALEYEIERQIERLTGGERVVQETRLWDAAAGRTVSMRSKEEAHDYRYFPEPDLPPVAVDAGRLRRIRLEMPRAAPTPRRAAPGRAACAARVRRRPADAVARPSGVFRGGRRRRRASQGGEQLDHGRAGAQAERTAPRRRSSRSARSAWRADRAHREGDDQRSMAKDVFEKMFARTRRPDAIVAAEGLAQIDDESQIVGLIADVLAKNADAVASTAAARPARSAFSSVR